MSKNRKRGAQKTSRGSYTKGNFQTFAEIILCNLLRIFLCIFLCCILCDGTIDTYQTYNTVKAMCTSYIGARCRRSKTSSSLTHMPRLRHCAGLQARFIYIRIEFYTSYPGHVPQNHTACQHPRTASRQEKQTHTKTVNLVSTIFKISSTSILYIAVHPPI